MFILVKQLLNKVKTRLKTYTTLYIRGIM